MELRVTHNLPAAQALFRKYSRQIPYATAIALNKTALDAQRYEQNWILRKFTIRNRFWMSRQIKHKPRANKIRQWTKLAIDPPGGRKRTDIIAKFEVGGRKRPMRRHIAIPSEAKRTASGKIQAKHQIKSFNFRKVGNTIRGDKRTWIIETGPSAGIYQRFGARRKKRAKPGTAYRAKGRYKMLYAFEGSVPIDNRLQFVPNITRIARKQFAGRFHNAWRQALRTAR